MQLQKTLWRHMKFWLQQWPSSSNKLQTSTPATNSSRWQNLSVTVNMIYSFCATDGAVVYFELFDLLQNWGLLFKSVMRNWWVVLKKKRWLHDLSHPNDIKHFLWTNITGTSFQCNHIQFNVTTSFHIDLHNYIQGHIFLEFKALLDLGLRTCFYIMK